MPRSSPAPAPVPAVARLFGLLSLTLPVGLLVMLLACNAVRLQHEGLRRDFVRAGLVAQTVSLGADRVHYWRGPPGDQRPPVLLLHGFGGDAVWQWAGQLPALVPDRTVLVPDLLWFGGSSSTDDDPTLDHQVAAMLALLDHEGLARVDVVGISYGGLVGTLLARTHGERVRRLVLVDSPGPDYTEQDHVQLLARFGVSNVAELIVPDDEDGVERLLQIAYYDPPPAPRFALRQVKEQMVDPYRAPQVALLHALVTHRDRYISDAPLDARLGLVWGDEDPVFPLAIGQRLAATHAAVLHVIPRARHAPNLEHPQRVNEALLDLLDGDGEG
ncbi:MAG: alpha/beta fold hydrolase [Myxococcota bacterium]